VVNLPQQCRQVHRRRGKIWLTAQQEGDELVLRVRDTGVGIAPELLPRILIFSRRQIERWIGRKWMGIA